MEEILSSSVRSIFIGCAWCVLAAASAGCGTHDTTVTFDTYGGYKFSRTERRDIQEVVDATAREVRRVLPALTDQLVLRVNAGPKVIPETGETGSTFFPNVVYWTVDPNHPGGVEAIVHRQLRLTLFHEFHHLVRSMRVKTTTLMDEVISEGMATVFERDLAGASVPWGAYPDNVSDWVDELRALPATASRTDWMRRHPDGRRWIGYKAGTYLVDRAMRSSGKSAAELASTPTDEVIKMAYRQ